MLERYIKMNGERKKKTYVNKEIKIEENKERV